MQEPSARQQHWRQLPSQSKWTIGVLMAAVGCIIVSAALAISARLLEWGGLIDV